MLRLRKIGCSFRAVCQTQDKIRQRDWMQPGKRVALLKCNNIEHRYDIYIYICVCECHIVICTYRNVISRNIVLSTLTGKYLVILLLNNIFEVEFLILQCCDPIVVLAQHALQGFCVGRRWKKIGQNLSCFFSFSNDWKIVIETN